MNVLFMQYMTSELRTSYLRNKELISEHRSGGLQAWRIPELSHEISIFGSCIAWYTFLNTTFGILSFQVRYVFGEGDGGGGGGWGKWLLSQEGILHLKMS